MARNQPGRGISRPVRMDEQYVEDYFVYSVNFADVDSGETVTGNIQIQADSDFKWIAAVYYCTIADAVFVDNTRPVPNATVQITDSGSGRQLFSNPVPIPSVFGTGRLPYLLPLPRVFMARSSIAFSVANFDAAQDNYEIRLALIGTKLFAL